MRDLILLCCDWLLRCELEPESLSVIFFFLLFLCGPHAHVPERPPFPDHCAADGHPLSLQVGGWRKARG